MSSKRKLPTELCTPAKVRRAEEVLTRGNNSLMQLNELLIKGLKWDIVQINDVFPQRFRGTCLFTESYSGLYHKIPAGATFHAEGTNKSTCRHAIADHVINTLTGNKLNIIKSPIASPPSVKNVPAIGNNEINSVRITIEDASRILNEKVPGIEYNYNPIENGFCCYVSFRGFMIKENGSSKKVSKRNVAAHILKKYFRYEFHEADFLDIPHIESTTPIDIDKLPLNRRKNFSNQIQALVNNEFDKLVSTLDVQYSKRKVSAGIVISRKLKIVFPNYYRQQDRDSLTPDVIDPMQFFLKTGWTINPDDCGEILKLITVSSGTKCLSGNEINSLGIAVNDCHAEVISKRALQYFLYRTILNMRNSVTQKPLDSLYGTDILEAVDQWTYKVKDDVKFHLYVSSSPCGDSRIFLPQAANNEESDNDNEEDTHPNRKNRGVLRTKIECGEGTIPIRTRHVQTWDGIIGGERLLTMSCSDKVCVWNILGLQGALLSNLLSHPIYLDSITIGSLFQLDHLLRALFERAKTVTDDPDWILTAANGNAVNDEEDLDSDDLKISADNVDRFQIKCPSMLSVTEQEEKAPGKASNFSVNWIIGDQDNLEIISTNKGTKIDNRTSRLSKRSLFRSFLDVFQWCRVISTYSGLLHYNDMKSLESCPDKSIGAANYQRKKIALFKYFVQQNFGQWIGKPMEQDWFSLKANS